MKKILYLMVLCLFLITGSPVMAAKSVKVSALTTFDSLKPVSTMKVLTLEYAEFKNGLAFKDGTIIYGEIFDVKQPKRGKLNASFKFRPISYTYNGKNVKIEDPEFIAKYAEYKELDKAAIATSAATTAGGMIFHIPLLSEGVSLVKGMWKNPENNRLKSGVVQVYKDSLFSYVEEGKDIKINKDQMFILKFKSSDIEDLDVPDENNDDVSDSANEFKNSSMHNNNLGSDIKLTEQDINSAIKYIEASHPDEVLREVELNSK